MRIVQAVFGVFHHFELARELERRGHLQMVYSTWPWRRLQREGLPHAKVQTFPWLHTSEYFAARAGFDGSWLTDELGYRNALAFDRWTDRRLRDCDALIAISGAGLLTGKHLQERGGIFICDRGSTHQRYQERVVSEEYARWGVAQQVSDERDTVREEEIYAQADTITVPSEIARKSFVEMGVAASKVEVIPYGVRLETFYQTLTPAPAHFDVLFAGSVSLRKGFPYLLEAFARFQHPAKRLRVAGGITSDIKGVLPRLPVEHVEFLGPVNQARLRDLMSESQVLVLPSIEDGFGLVIPQAMACGCPVICTEAAGAASTVIHGENGWLVAPRSPEAIASVFEELASTRGLREQMKTTCQETVRQLGGWERYGDQWEALLQRLTAKAGLQPPPTK